MGLFSKIFGDGGKQAANASLQGSQIQADAQREALGYFQGVQKPLIAARDQGLQGLTGLYGEGGGEYQQELIDRAQNSPLYAQMMGNRQFGEDAIMRNASATGGLRSGNTQYNLNDYNTRLSNDALLQSYNQQVQGLEGLSRVGTDEARIANMMSGIGQTEAQGLQGYAQARQEGQGGLFGNLMSLGKVGLKAAAIGGFSDPRLKKNMHYIGDRNGHRWYAWKWNKQAEKLGLKGESEGVIASQVLEYMPEAIGERDGFITVNYEMLGVQ